MYFQEAALDKQVVGISSLGLVLYGQDSYVQEECGLLEFSEVMTCIEGIDPSCVRPLAAALPQAGHDVNAMPWWVSSHYCVTCSDIGN